MNIFLKVGIWLDKRFPEKITAQEVRDHFDAHIQGINGEINWLKEEIKRMDSVNKAFRSELETFKTQSIVKTRIASALTPFAQRLPSTGGNQSPA